MEIKLLVYILFICSELEYTAFVWYISRNLLNKNVFSKPCIDLYFFSTIEYNIWCVIVYGF